MYKNNSRDVGPGHKHADCRGFSVIPFVPSESKLISKLPVDGGDRAEIGPLRSGICSRPAPQVAAIRPVHRHARGGDCCGPLDVSPLGLYVGGSALRLLVILGRSSLCESLGRR